MEFLEILKAAGSVFLMLFAFILVLVLAWGTVRMLGKHYTITAGSGSYIKVIDKVSLSQDKSLCIVQVANQTFLLGIAPQAISAICSLESDKLIPLSEESVPLPFAQMLKSMLGRRSSEGKEEES